MDHGQILPLFPLGIVVFPDQALPLHIFEDRYKEMIADCCAEGEGEYEPFGLSFEHEGNVAPVGCAVQVMKVTRQYSNGTFDIVCRAVWRYRTLEVREHERSYLMAHVERLDDEEVGPVDHSIRLLVRERLGQLTDLAAQDMGSLGYGSHDDDPEQSLDALDVGLKIPIDDHEAAIVDGHAQGLDFAGRGARLRHHGGRHHGGGASACHWRAHTVG